MARPSLALLAFGLELAALWGFGAAGWSIAAVAGGPRWIIAAIAAAAGIGLWAWLAAPRSRHRLRGAALFAFKLAFLAAATMAFGLAYGRAAMGVFGLLACLHLALLLRFGNPAA